VVYILLPPQEAVKAMEEHILLSPRQQFYNVLLPVIKIQQNISAQEWRDTISVDVNKIGFCA